MNCSQKLISLIFGTTVDRFAAGQVQLWIALKSWYLWYSEQPFHQKSPQTTRCELLSKVDIFDIRNNNKSFTGTVVLVVNCSQKLISLIFGTTSGDHHRTLHGLWIALKSWYLWYSEQQGLRCDILYISCELLSKVDIFDIRNN